MERDSSITGVVSSNTTLINAIKCQVYEFIKSDRLIQSRVKKRHCIRKSIVKTSDINKENKK